MVRLQDWTNQLNNNGKAVLVRGVVGGAVDTLTITLRKWMEDKIIIIDEGEKGIPVDHAKQFDEWGDEEFLEVYRDPLFLSGEFNVIYSIQIVAVFHDDEWVKIEAMDRYRGFCNSLNVSPLPISRMENSIRNHFDNKRGSGV